MGLIKEVNETLENQLREQEQYYTDAVEKVNVVLESEYHGELFETADQFLSHVAGMIKSGEKLNPEQAKMLGAKLASLELLADPGTRGAALSVVTGSDPSKKLATIMKQTSGADQPSGQVDKVLIALAGRVGKSGSERNAQMFAGLEGMNEKDRAAKAAEIAALANKFKQIEAKMQTSSAPPAEPAAA